MQEIQREWLRRVEAEYTSAAITQQLTLWLLQITAPLELVRLGLSIVEDELSHAELSQAVYLVAGGSAPAELQRARLGLRLAPGGGVGGGRAARRERRWRAPSRGWRWRCSVSGRRWRCACSRACASAAASRWRSRRS